MPAQWALFCNSNYVKLLFPNVFDELLSLYVPSFSSKFVSSSHHRTNTYHVGVLNLQNQINSKRILNPGQDRREMQVCDYKSSKGSMHNTESFSNVESN